MPWSESISTLFDVSDFDNLIIYSNTHSLRETIEQSIFFLSNGHKLKNANSANVSYFCWRTDHILKVFMAFIPT